MEYIVTVSNTQLELWEDAVLMQELGFTLSHWTYGGLEYWEIENPVGDAKIEVNTIEELNAFIDKYGRIIISEKPNGWTIEIYNGWRE